MISVQYDLSMTSPAGAPRGGGVAFLLAQVGAHAMSRFSEAVAPLGLTPPLVGIMRVLSTAPSLSQNALADLLRMAPSRLVAHVDQLESLGWVARERHPSDRRVNLLTVTDQGRDGLAAIADVARAHERVMTHGLGDEDRATLAHLLGLVAAEQGLAPGVHPGYRTL
jgi:DNA-binding MarR family transcriptional regulator